MTTKSHWHGIFELALFMYEGAHRVAQSRSAGLASFAVPVIIMLLDFIPLLIEPAGRLGPSSFTELVALYTPILVPALAVQTALIYAVLGYAGKKDRFWPTLGAVNCLSFAPFVLSYGIYMLVMFEAHTWKELHPLLLTIEFYGVAISAYAVTRIGLIPWELAGATALFNFLMANHITEFVFSLHGID